MKLSLINEQTEIETLTQQLQLLYPSIKILHASENAHEIHLHSIEIQPGERNKGTGAAVLTALKHYAARKHKPIVLTAQAEAGKKGALERFYRNNDFRKPGRARDYRLSRHTHLWRPRFEN